ncbi:ribonuclease H-like domain-containing protein [Tanacetum coccineum]
MVTRAQVGTVKPNPRFHGHTSHISPLPMSPSIALSNPNWRDVMYDEYNALIQNSTWILVLKPPNVNMVRSMWLFRHKYHVDGSLSRYKARLVANLQRSLYGLKQAPRAWFQRFAGYALRVGFSSSRCDSSLFIYQHGTEVAYLLIYVDEIILTASSTRISVTHDSTGMFLSQKKYAMELLDRAHMASCNPTRTPFDTESKLSVDGDLVSDPTLYSSLAGGLQYLTFTRPDISYAIQQVCLHMHDPR